MMQEARAFLIGQETEPGARGRLRLLAPPIAAPDVLSDDEIWRAQRWIKQGLDLLGRDERWNFAPRVRYEIDAHKGLLWTRLKATSRLQLLKALVFEAFREARFKFRRCRACPRGFVPIRRQAYCSPRCSQAARTKKWRKAHPEKNRAIRRAQYQKSIAAKLKLSANAAVKIAKVSAS